MKFVSTSQSALIRASMAHMFLERAYQEKRLNDISNMDEVLKALDPHEVFEEIFSKVENIIK